MKRVWMGMSDFVMYVRRTVAGDELKTRGEFDIVTLPRECSDLSAEPWNLKFCNGHTLTHRDHLLPATRCKESLFHMATTATTVTSSKPHAHLTDADAATKLGSPEGVMGVMGVAILLGP